MDNKISKIKKRILHFAKIKNITQVKMCEIIGMSHGSFKGKARNRPLNSDAIEILLSVFPDVNLDWLFSGNGEPLKEMLPKIYADDPKNNFLVNQIMELTRQNEQLRIDNRILLNQSKQTPLKLYAESETESRVAEPVIENNKVKTQNRKG